MLVGLAFCPHPPLLVPECSQVAMDEFRGLRAACDLAVSRMLGENPDVVVVVGGGRQARAYRKGDWGSLEPYGIPVHAGLGPGRRDEPAELTLSLTIGAWLLDRGAWTGDRWSFTIPPSATEDDLSSWADRTAAAGGSGSRVAMLVMGDGSARRDTGAPGYVDPRAVVFDRAVARCLADGDPTGLAGLDPALGNAVMAAGTQPWRLAGRVAGRSPGGSAAWQSDLLAEQAPYGVCYLVAAWITASRS